MCLEKGPIELAADWVKVGRLLEHQVSIEDVREDPGAYRCSFGVPSGPSPESNACQESVFEIPVGLEESIKAICYRPSTSKQLHLAAHVNFHGGGTSRLASFCQIDDAFYLVWGWASALTGVHDTGWTIGNIGSDAAWCQKLAIEADVAVFDIGYRLAPEHKFPTAIEDSWKALAYVSH